MNIRKVLATGTAATLLGTGLALAPAVIAAPSSAVVEQAAAAYGWGGECKVTRVRVGSSGSWWIYRKTVYRYWSDSLTGTTCRAYSSSTYYVAK